MFNLASALIAAFIPAFRTHATFVNASSQHLGDPPARGLAMLRTQRRSRQLPAVSTFPGA
jgi:hypothetical protein